MPDIPRSRSDVTPAWLTDVLSTSLTNATVTAIAFEPLQSLTSTMHRLRVEYAAPTRGLPQRLIWKQSSTDPAARTAFGHAAGSAYEREVTFYREVAPTIETRTPRCYLAEYDPASDEHVLLLEDLEASHHAGDPLGIPVTAVRGVVRELAHLHAARWNAIDPRESPFSREATLRFFDDCFAGGRTFLETALDAESLRALGPFRERYLDWQDRLLDGPLTLVHTDTHPANVLVARHARERPVIIDWQGWRTGAPMRDVGRCLARSLTTTQRRRHTRSLITGYLEALAEHGIDYPEGDALDDYRLGAALEWSWAVTFTRQQRFWNADLREAMPELVRRAAAAALESLAV